MVSLGKDPIQLPHAMRKIAVWRLDQEMVMVGHKTIGMTEAIKPFDDGCEYL